jgi:hypothetical protein
MKEWSNGGMIIEKGKQKFSELTFKMEAAHFLQNIGKHLPDYPV